eukprot:8485993-Pyramimonas_sp.AAC.1
MLRERHRQQPRRGNPPSRLQHSARRTEDNVQRNPLGVPSPSAPPGAACPDNRTKRERDQITWWDRAERSRPPMFRNDAHQGRELPDPLPAGDRAEPANL